MRVTSFATALLMASTPLAAQSPAPAVTPAAEGEDITVIGLGERAYRLTPAQLRGAVAGFEQNRMEFAPTAQLSWNVMPRGPHPEVRLALKNDVDVLPVPLGADGSFTLPHDKILTGQWRLVTTVAKGAIKIMPLALSAGSTREQFRFGDARLSCRVLWGFLSSQYSIVMRGVFATVGGCASPSVSIYYSTEKPLAAIGIDHWAKPVEISKNGKAWRVPLHEKAISNDAITRLTYREP